MWASFAAWAKVARQELHRTLGAGKVRRAAVAVAPVVRLDPPDRRQHLPVELEPGRRLLVEGEVRGRDVGDIGRDEATDPGRPPPHSCRRGRPRRPDHDGDEDHDAGRRSRSPSRSPQPLPLRAVTRYRAARTCASAASRSAGRVVSIAYSRRLTDGLERDVAAPDEQEPLARARVDERATLGGREVEVAGRARRRPRGSGRAGRAGRTA